MNAEVNYAASPVTPAFIVGQEFIEPITTLMSYCGIEAISADKYNCGYGSKLHVTISAFSGAPQKIVDQGIVVKDALAQLLAVANINRLVIKPSEMDLEGLRSGWRKYVHDASVANRGSGQDFTQNDEKEG